MFTGLVSFILFFVVFEGGAKDLANGEREERGDICFELGCPIVDCTTVAWLGLTAVEDFDEVLVSMMLTVLMLPKASENQL